MCENCAKRAPASIDDVTHTVSDDYTSPYSLSWLAKPFLDDSPFTDMGEVLPTGPSVFATQAYDKFLPEFDQFSGGLNKLFSDLETLPRDAANDDTGKKAGIYDGSIHNTIPGDNTTTATLAVGGSVNGTIDFAGDSDWYEVTVTRGTTYQFQLTSTGTGAITNGDTVLYLYNPNGSLVTFDDEGGTGSGSMISFTAQRDGVIYVGAEAYGNATGNYDLSATTLLDDDVTNGPIKNDAILTVNGAASTGTIDYVTDQDWFTVELTAGTTYTFNLTGTGGTPLDDPAMGLHNSNGVLLDYNDDTNGYDPELTFTPTSSGTYYISVEAFTGYDPTATGDYSLTASSSGGGGGSTPTGSPLDSLDWGTQLASNTLNVYFAGVGETFNGVASLGWTQAEIDAAMAALQMYENYLDITIQQVFTASEATFKLLTDEMNDGTLGYFYPPGQGSASGVGVFISNGYGWSTAGLQPGGYGWITLIHEFGHGFGLAHPHDTGGTSEVMSGVSSSSDTGDFDLNQGVFTTMSYIDGWSTSPYGQSSSTAYGWQSTIMALDIALLQDKYGANTTFNSTNNKYALDKVNNSGTDWTTIWDTGGTADRIEANTSLDAVIDLRAATLSYEEGGGGYLSYVYGIHGGFTIANGVEIEQAVSGNGNDTVTGNDLDNFLGGRNGDDIILGLGGNDRIFGGADNDRIVGGTGQDQLKGGTGDDTFVFAVGDSLTSGVDRIFNFGAGDKIELPSHSFLGTGAFTSDTGVEIRALSVNGNIRLDIDYDGDNVVDEKILIIRPESGIELVSDGTTLTAQLIVPAAADEPVTFAETGDTDISDFLTDDFAIVHDDWALIA